MATRNIATESIGQSDSSPLYFSALHPFYSSHFQIRNDEKNISLKTRKQFLIKVKHSLKTSSQAQGCASSDLRKLSNWGFETSLWKQILRQVSKTNTQHCWASRVSFRDASAPKNCEISDHLVEPLRSMFSSIAAKSCLTQNMWMKFNNILNIFQVITHLVIVSNKWLDSLSISPLILDFSRCTCLPRTRGQPGHPGHPGLDSLATDWPATFVLVWPVIAHLSTSCHPAGPHPPSRWLHDLHTFT